MNYSCRFCGYESSYSLPLGLCSDCRSEERDHRREKESAAQARVEADERDRVERKEQEMLLLEARNLLAECMVSLSALESEFPVGAVVSENNQFILRVAALQAKLRLLEMKQSFFSELEEMKEMHSIRFRVIEYISRQASAGLLMHDPFETTHKRLEELSNAFDYCNVRINKIFSCEIATYGASEKSLNQAICDLNDERESLGDIQKDISDRLKSQGLNSLKGEMQLLNFCAINFVNKNFLDYSAYVYLDNFAKGEGVIADKIAKRFESVRSDVLGMIELNKIHKENIESAIACAKSGDLNSASSLFEKLGDVRFADVNYTMAQAAIQELSLAVGEFDSCRFYLSQKSIFIIGPYAENVNEASLVRHLNKYKAESAFGFSARKTYKDFRRAKRSRLIMKIIALCMLLVALFAVRGCIGGRVVGDRGGEVDIGGGIGVGDPSTVIHADIINDSVGDLGNRSEILMDFYNIDFPVLVTMIKGCDLMDSDGQERDIPIGKRLRVLNRKENGILEIDIAGDFYVGHESRIIGKVKIEKVENKSRFVMPQLESNVEDANNKMPVEEQRESSVERGARTAEAKSHKDAEEPSGTLSDEQEKSSGDREAGSAKAELKAKLKLARAELAEVNDEIAAERARWHNALAVINRLTFNKTRPVREGSPEYYRCLEASKVIQEVEAGAPKLKAKRAGLEAEIMELEK